MISVDDAQAIWFALEEETPLPLLGDIVAEGTYEGKVYSKGRPRFNKNGHAFTPENTRKFEARIKDWLYGIMGEPVTYPCSVKVIFSDPIPKSVTKWRRFLIGAGLQFSTVGDLDNRCKTILDAMNEIVFFDDKQVVELYTTRAYGPVEGFSIEVTRAGYSAAELDVLRGASGG